MQMIIKIKIIIKINCDNDNFVINNFLLTPRVTCWVRDTIFTFAIFTDRKAFEMLYFQCESSYV